MADITVSSERLHGVSQSLASGADDVQSQLARMESEVRGLVDADWQGAASQSFNELYSQWQTSATQLRESLVGISQLLGQSASAYEETEQQIASSMRQ